MSKSHIALRCRNKQLSPNKTRIFAGLLAFAFALGSTAAAVELPAQRRAPQMPAGPMFSLQQAIVAMQRGHLLLQATKANVRAAAADTVGAGLWTNPTLDGGYARGITSAQNDVAGYISLGVTQFVETAGAPGARRQAAAMVEQAVLSDGQTLSRGLEYSVEEAYVALAAAATRQLVYLESNEELERANQIVHARVKAGAAPNYDATRIAVALAQSQASLGDAEANMLRSRGDLDAAIGPEATALNGLPALDLYEIASASTLENWLEIVQRERPDVRAAQNRAKAAQAQVAVARAAVQPGFGLRGGIAYGNTPQEFDILVGISLPLPLNDRGQGAIASALAHAESANFAVDALALQAVQRVRSAYHEFVRRRLAHAAYFERGVFRSLSMVSEAEAGYRAGKLSVLELVDAYVANRDSRLRAIDLAESAQLADVKLRRAVYAGPRDFGG